MSSPQGNISVNDYTEVKSLKDKQPQYMNIEDYTDVAFNARKQSHLSPLSNLPSIS
jgi:hypothetical protein